MYCGYVLGGIQSFYALTNKYVFYELNCSPFMHLKGKNRVTSPSTIRSPPDG